METHLFQNVLDLINSGFRPMLARVRPTLIFMGLFLMWLEAIRMAIRWAFDHGDWRYDLYLYTIRGAVVMFFLFVSYGAYFGVNYESWIQLGLKAGGNKITVPNFLDPGQYIHLGFRSGEPLWKEIRFSTVVSSEPVGIAFFFAWCFNIAAYIVLAFSIFMAQVEVSVALIGTAVMLPFYLFTPTRWMAQGALTYPVNKGFRMFLLAILASVMFDIIKNELSLATGAPRTWWQVLTKMPDEPSNHLQQAAVLIIATWVIALLYTKTSTMSSAILSGRPSLTGSMAMHAAIGTAFAGATVAGGATAGLLIGAGGQGGYIGPRQLPAHAGPLSLASAIGAAQASRSQGAGMAGLQHTSRALTNGLITGARFLAHE